MSARRIASSIPMPSETSRRPSPVKSDSTDSRLAIRVNQEYRENLPALRIETQASAPHTAAPAARGAALTQIELEQALDEANDAAWRRVADAQRTVDEERTFASAASFRATSSSTARISRCSPRSGALDPPPAAAGS
jgi:hypothetical protein